MSNESLQKEFAKVVGQDNVMTSESEMHAYSYDSAVLDQVSPAMVVRPTSSEALGQVVKLCNDNELKLTVRGAGTNLSGGTIPHPGGIVCLTTALNNILEINEEDLYAVVEPGVITAKFAAQVASKGLLYPPDPGSQAVSTLGGNVAENAGGLRALKYGVTKDYVMGVDFFDVNGELVKSGSRTVKCVTGYNLAGLMVASEGTLGVFEKLILKLVPPPKAIKSMMAEFDDVAAASQAVSAIIAAKIVPATLEFMDNFTIKTVENFRGAGLNTEAAALLLLEVDGHPAQVEDDAAQVQEICNKLGARQFTVAQDAKQRDAVWQARRDALPALARVKPTTVLEDATVPRSKIPDMMQALKRIAREYKLTIGTFGHAGDGNLHPTILTDKRDTQEWERVEKAIDEIFDVALDLGGTLSGEHGIGIAKSKFMHQEHGLAAIEYSRRMKSVLDPKDILNPGKMLGPLLA
ncbi:FAD linked oxidase domain protein [Desulfonatronospira thiodismutans ASO3-1]|uniref:FAD linked oxidase domain protein n=1 Tax=Desulfonatronospira thiodismutans ASO3-1 TaxID=555779 RepID=D6SLE4_9BACT|nr:MULTISPECIES: FAD-linked oxidase C-terminal domain-containing protein [Desulfonatronospira]EFI35505.1 FAD linked oxidase domain protein [Desulfonatronospira thiodismutans ASO3-1]RQD77625.1 MAG: FAD-binding protein [Desulfonatronospira sp. MSAO_Bac3]